MENIATGAAVPIRDITYQPEVVEFLMINLDADLEQGAQYKVTFGHFIGEITADLKGMYYSSYNDNGTTRFV